MKVGIVSIYDNSNFGNRLQNYALQEILRKYADEVVTIKNKAASSSKLDQLARKLNIADIPALNILLGKKKRASMLRFTNQYINNSKQYYYHDKNYDYPIENCDIYCAGSDQVWNPTLKVTGPLHFLGFSKRDNNFSFSASFGIDHIDDKNIRNKIAQGLQNFKNLSVREEAGRKLIHDQLDIETDVEVLIDPTLYFSADEWEKIEKRPKSLNTTKYIVTYFLGEVSDNRRKRIDECAKENNYEVLDLLDVKSRIYSEIGPSEFVYLIHHAKMICTDSFHASIFSFIFEKPLLIYRREDKKANMGSRMVTLVDKFGLTMVEDETKPIYVMEADYRKGHEALVLEKEKVDSYLERVFSQAKNAKARKTKLYACYNTDDDIRKISSSGGIYYLLAKKTIENGGVVYAACYEGLYVKHKRITLREDIVKSCGAKYIPSYLGNTFNQIRQDLLEGRQVLFVGQPCQCAGLRKLVGENDNLLLVDFVCHGVPDNAAWKRYLESMEKKGFHIRSVNMRDKSTGWKNYNWKIVTEEQGAIIQSRKENPYMKGFLSNLYLHQACYSCKYKGIERISDITLGDYWGINEAHPDMNDDKGVSLVMIHSKTGSNALEDIRASLCIVETTEAKAIKRNPSIIMSPYKPRERLIFEQCMLQGDDFCETVNRLTQPNKFRSLMVKIDRKIKRIKLS